MDLRKFLTCQTRILNLIALANDLSEVVEPIKTSFEKAETLTPLVQVINEVVCGGMYEFDEESFCELLEQASGRHYALNKAPGLIPVEHQMFYQSAINYTLLKFGEFEL